VLRHNGPVSIQWRVDHWHPKPLRRADERASAVPTAAVATAAAATARARPAAVAAAACTHLLGSPGHRCTVLLRVRHFRWRCLLRLCVRRLRRQRLQPTSVGQHVLRWRCHELGDLLRQQRACWVHSAAALATTAVSSTAVASTAALVRRGAA
jgi:hypothetical protein